MTRLKRTQRAFTLVELMIVVVVIGLLAAIAVPAYQSFAIRSKVSEALVAAAACTTAVSDYLASTNSLPANLTASGCAMPATKYVAGVDVVDGVITVTMAVSSELGGASGGTLTMSPTLNANKFITTWACVPDTLPAQYLPSSCRG